MKSLFAFWVPVICAAGLAVPASAQFGARSGALGGNFASRGMSRPLGGIPPAVSPSLKPGLPGRPGVGVNHNNRGFERQGFGRGVAAYPYAYSFYVPNYFDDGYYDQNSYAPAPAAPAYSATPPPSQQQPVIINQYFSSASPEQANPPATANNTQVPGDVLGPDQNYYLIAYKNHAVYAAIAYWLEDKTLHYVTTQNTHNQASLDLIDLDLTKSLNQARDVPFSIAGK
jgi:hypothetical protein